MGPDRRPLIASQPTQYFPSNFSLPVSAVQEDVENPGTLLAILGYALVRIAGNITSRSITPLTGSISHGGIVDGNATDARLTMVPSFLQMPNESRILFIETLACCIRQVLREDWSVSTFSGQCGSRSQTDGEFLSARFVFPNDLAFMPYKNNTVLVLEASTLRVLDLNTRITSTVPLTPDDSLMIGLQNQFISFNRMLVGGSSEIYITTSGSGLYRLNSSLVVDNVYQPAYYDVIYGVGNDGEWTKGETKLMLSVLGIASLTKDTLLLTTGDGLFGYNVQTGDASRLCSNSALNSPSDILCQYTDARFISLINSTLYMLGYTPNPFQTVELNSKLNLIMSSQHILRVVVCRIGRVN